MPFDRTPRKMLTCWVRNKRPVGSPTFTYGRSVKKAMKKVGIDVNAWPNIVLDRDLWRCAINRV